MPTLDTFSTSTPDLNSYVAGGKQVGSTITDNKFLLTDLTSFFNTGASPVKANADLMGQTIVGIIVNMPAAGGVHTYSISSYLNVTSITTNVMQVKVDFTDENNIPQSLILLSGANSSLFYTVPTVNIRSKAGISVKTILSVSGGSMTFDCGATVSLVI